MNMMGVRTAKNTVNFYDWSEVYGCSMKLSAATHHDTHIISRQGAGLINRRFVRRRRTALPE